VVPFLPHDCCALHLFRAQKLEDAFATPGESRTKSQLALMSTVLTTLPFFQVTIRSPAPSPLPIARHSLHPAHFVQLCWICPCSCNCKCIFIAAMSVMAVAGDAGQRHPRIFAGVCVLLAVDTSNDKMPGRTLTMPGPSRTHETYSMVSLCRWSGSGGSQRGTSSLTRATQSARPWCPCRGKCPCGPGRTYCSVRMASPRT
jgi:hypothetical protein